MEQTKVIQEVFGFIAALRTMLDNYPELQRNETLMRILESNSPLEFLLAICELCGFSLQDLLGWLSRLLSGFEAKINEGIDYLEDEAKNSNSKMEDKVGLLDVIEEGIKYLLLANVKNMFTCSINPMIPKDVLKYPVDNPDDGLISSKGIVIPLSTIDMFNALDKHPGNKEGKNYYFDNNMVSKDFWKSSDFNVFLWYIINKGTNINNEGLKKIWDNRIKYRRTKFTKEGESKDIFRTNFFNTFKGNNTYISANEIEELKKYEKNTKKETKKAAKEEGTYNRKEQRAKYLKKQYILVDYNEISPTVTTPNTITIWLNADRYRHKVNLSDNLSMYYNSTIFEFNYDYIMSLKLFDSKTIVAHVINSLFDFTRKSVSSVFNSKYSFEEEVIAGMVGKIVTKVMEDGDTKINDCFFTFSNDEYDKLLTETENRKKDGHQFGELIGNFSEEEINEINNSINNISSASSIVEQQDIIKNLFNGVSEATSAKNGEVLSTDKFIFGGNIVLDLIKQSVTQIVLQVLSPKVMLLYALNSYFMGDVSDGDFSKINVEGLLKGLQNLIIDMVKLVLELIVKELLRELLLKIKDLLNAAYKKIIKERLDYYIEIIKGLISLIEMFYNSFAGGDNPNSVIDNVNYADIVKPLNGPTDTIDKKC